MEKKSFSSNLKLGKFRTLLKNLTKDQKDLVKFCGFGSILDFDCSEAPRSVSFWLAKNFDVPTRTVNLQNGSSFILNPFTVHQILGTPLGGRRVPTRASKAVKDIIGSDTGTAMVAPTVDQLFSLLNRELVGDKFVRIFMLIALAIFLCPTSYGSASSHYYSGIASVEDIPKYDWSSFVLDWLATSIQKFQESAAKGNAIGKDRTSSLGGCLFVLAVTYFEYIRTSEILLRDDIPRLKIWDDYMIQEFLALDGNSGDGRAFGLLELKDTRESPFLAASISSASFSRLPAQVEDFILRLSPDDAHHKVFFLALQSFFLYFCTPTSNILVYKPSQQVRKDLSDMCRSFYKDLMGSALAAIQPVIIKQMCKMAQVMFDELTMNSARGISADTNTSTQGQTTVSMKCARIQNQSGVKARSPHTTLDTNRAQHADVEKSPNGRSVLNASNVNTRSPSTIQCAQHFRYNDPQSSSRLNVHGAANETCDHEQTIHNEGNILHQGSQNVNPDSNPIFSRDDRDDFISKGDSTPEKDLTAPGNKSDTPNDLVGMTPNIASNPQVDHPGSCEVQFSPSLNCQMEGDLNNNSKGTPVCDVEPDSRLYTDRVVPDSFERSCNVVRKTATQLLSIANDRGDKTSANNGPKKNRRLGMQFHNDTAPKLVLASTISDIEISSEDNSPTKVSTGKKCVPVSSPVVSDRNLSSNSEEDEEDSVQIILSDKFTRRRAIKLPRSLASPSVCLDIPRQKITVSKFESDLYYMSTKRIGKKVKSKTIACISRFHVDHRTFWDSMRSRCRVGTFTMNVFYEACNSDYRDNPNMKPSKCFLTSDAIDILKSKKSTVCEAVEILSPEITRFSMRDFNMVMIPVCHSGHWWLIVANLRDHRFDILNSCEMNSTSCIITSLIVSIFFFLFCLFSFNIFCAFFLFMPIDSLGALTRGFFFHFLFCCFNTMKCDKFRKAYDTMFKNSDIINKNTFPVRVQQAPQQTTTHDCGIFVMKFLQTWDDRKLQNISQSVETSCANTPPDMFN
ncbi:uncharacterized protein LOC120651171 isoform X3 [Panicum virgatum]|uniref:uncharacterized protein LOC120651171 isoform X3 n=1 Tax=Panicum virgatum TaxID=38727 RepID=UPI0019D6735C|nr:uncharacterized protein LOC120651171 isoform X3 [Panicum virgatum]XP_039784505.1 uncharacterized protein LOC120651171 isoform X3 [Panicum virgatum]